MNLKCMEIKKLVVGEIRTNCFLLCCGGELAVIDPGGDAKKILDEASKMAAKPKFIINTHYHLDHTLANNEMREKLDVPVLIHENEKKFVDFHADRFFKDGDVLQIGDCPLKVVSTPGHTKGSVCLFAPDFVISGDTIFEEGIGRMDLPGGSMEDMERSLKKLDGMIPEGTTIYPGHGNIFKYRKGMALFNY